LSQINEGLIYSRLVIVVEVCERGSEGIHESADPRLDRLRL
jgi:hypothetical protein